MVSARFRSFEVVSTFINYDYLFLLMFMPSIFSLLIMLFQCYYKCHLEKQGAICPHAHKSA